MQIGDFAGGVAAQGDCQLGLGDAAAVVFDGNQAHTARRQTHGDLARAGVQRVIDQLAHHRGGAFDHFASGNLADQFVGQVTDGAACGS